MTPQDQSVPYGYCHCGCGVRTKISLSNLTVRGYIKGVPRRFVPGHNMPRPGKRVGCVCGNVECSVPYGHCHCGCGEKTPLAPCSNRSHGYIKGEPYQFCLRHANRWEPDELEKLKENLDKMSYAKIAKMLPGRTINAIRRRVFMVGFERHSIPRPRSKQDSSLARGYGRFPRRRLKENYFSLPTLTNSYWAGFLAADGCIVTEPRTELRLGLHSRDIEHMKRFIQDIGFDGSIGIDKKGCCHVTICAAYQVVNDLKSVFNIGERKTFTLEPPSLTGEMALAYSIGVIDGDGCWATCDAGAMRRRLILVVVGTEPLLSWLAKTWNESGANIGTPNLHRGKGCWRLALSGCKAERVAGVLAAVDTPKLDRKWRVARREADGQEDSKKRI